MVFGKPTFGNWRISIDDAKHFVCDAQRYRQYRTNSLQDHCTAGKTWVVLRVRSQNRLTPEYDLLEHIAADTYLANFPNAIAQASHGDAQLFAAFRAHHQQTPIRRHSFKHERHDLLQRLS